MDCKQWKSVTSNWVTQRTTQAIGVTDGVALRASGAHISRCKGRHAGYVDCEVVADEERGIIGTASTSNREPGTL